jgi:hypothetical protein
MGDGTSGGLKIFKLSEEGDCLWQRVQNVVPRIWREVNFVRIVGGLYRFKVRL